MYCTKAYSGEWFPNWRIQESQGSPVKMPAFKQDSHDVSKIRNWRPCHVFFLSFFLSAPVNCQQRPPHRAYKWGNMLIYLWPLHKKASGNPCLRLQPQHHNHRWAPMNRGLLRMTLAGNTKAWLNIRLQSIPPDVEHRGDRVQIQSWPELREATDSLRLPALPAGICRVWK